MRAWYRDTALSGIGADGILDLDEAAERAAQIVRPVRADYARPLDRGQTLNRAGFRAWKEYASGAEAFARRRSEFAHLLRRAAGESLLVLESAEAGPAAVLRHAVVESLATSAVGVAAGFAWQFAGAEWEGAELRFTYVDTLPTTGTAAGQLPAGAVMDAVLIHCREIDPAHDIRLGVSGDLARYLPATEIEVGWRRYDAEEVAAESAAVDLLVSRVSGDALTDLDLRLYIIYHT